MELITRWWIFGVVAILVLVLALINIAAGNIPTAAILILLALTLGVRGYLKRRQR